MAQQQANNGANDNTWNANIDAARAANLALDPPQAWDDCFALQHCLRICGFITRNQHRAWIREGMIVLADFGKIREKDVSEICKDFDELPAHAFHCSRVQQYQALALNRWVRNTRDTDTPLDAHNWTDEEMGRLTREVQDHPDDEDVEKTDVEKPPKFTGFNWRKWERMALNYFFSLPSSGNPRLPLVYITREVRAPPRDNQSEIQRLIYSARLQGGVFDRDNNRVYRLLAGWLIGSVGEAYTNRYVASQNGRQAWLGLSGHYNGPDKMESRASEARKLLATLKYTGNEKQFSFETFSVNLTEAIEVLIRDGREQWNDARRVHKLFERIDTDAVTNRRLQRKLHEIEDRPIERKEEEGAFEAFKNEIATTISKGKNERLTTLLVPGTRRENRTISQVGSERGGRPQREGGDRGGRGGRGDGRGRGRGRGGRGGRGNNNNMINGVDVSDPNRRFTDVEWERLRSSDYMPTLRRRRRESENRGNRRWTPYNGGGRSVASRLSALESAMVQHQADDASALTGDTQAQGAAVSQDGTRASNGGAFGANGARGGPGRAVGGRGRGRGPER